MSISLVALNSISFSAIIKVQAVPPMIVTKQNKKLLFQNHSCTLSREGTFKLSLSESFLQVNEFMLLLHVFIFSFYEYLAILHVFIFSLTIEQQAESLLPAVL